MKNEILNPSMDEDEIWLFERIAKQLQKRHGHSEVDAMDFIKSYYKKFTDADYCERYNMSAQNTDFFHREESILMADRIQFYEVLKNLPDERCFIDWQKNIT